QREQVLRLDAENAWHSEEKQRRQVEELSRKEKAARDKEEEARRREEGLRSLVLNARVAVAEREFSAHNLERAEALLDLCPPDQRRWEWHYLKRLCHTELFSLKPGDGPMSCLALSPDGKVLAVGDGHPYQPDKEGCVRLFDAATLRPISTFPPEHGATMELAFSQDGKHLAGVVVS